MHDHPAHSPLLHHQAARVAGPRVRRTRLTATIHPKAMAGEMKRVCNPPARLAGQETAVTLSRKIVSRSSAFIVTSFAGSL